MIYQPVSLNKEFVIKIVLSPPPQSRSVGLCYEMLVLFLGQVKVALLVFSVPL